MFRRKVYDYLKNWKEESNGSSAVLIEGARRVGKSTVAEEFAKSEYEDYILIDFSTAEQAIKDNFENIGNLDTFFRNLFILTGKSLPKRKSVIIFDEVQFFPIAHRNSSKSIGYIFKFSSSEGMSMSLTFFFIDIKEPVSI